MVSFRTEAPLKELYKDAFHIGAAVNPGTIERQRSLLAYHFNSLTAENEMKFSSVHPKEELYTFEDADIIAAFAREHGMALRGHTLVWHNQTPEWLFENKAGGWWNVLYCWSDCAHTFKPSLADIRTLSMVGMS